MSVPDHPAAATLPKERLHFTELLLSNHFGTIAGSNLAAKFSPKGNTTYEQLTCVGYQPAAQRLDATVNIKQGAGYSGGICSAGSQEFVKFFTSTDSGGTWVERGTASFTVFDVPGPKPLEYSINLKVDLGADCCKHENLVLVRAILSWSVPPGGATDPVVWGNSLDATIQVAPLTAGTVGNLFKCLDIGVASAELAALLDTEQVVTFGTSAELTPLQLHETYEQTHVHASRYLFPYVQELLASPAAMTTKLATPGYQLFPGVTGIDIAKLIPLWIDPQGNETYEELGCLGLNPITTELVATIDVKLSSGYSGGLCTKGSKELVAFWVDWEDGTGWHYVGTTATAVHDIKSFPSGGLRYSVSLPFPELYLHRKPCAKGPRTARIRAVLSWQTPPSTTNPYAVPVWGGHDETTILLPPGDAILPGGGPHLETIGAMDTVLDIDGFTGLATKPGVCDQSPFGGQVWFSGHVFNRYAAAFGGAGIHYRIWISVDGGSPVAMNATFPVATHHYLSGTSAYVTQSPVNLGGTLGDGWYPYLEDSANLVTVDGNVLGYWETAAGGNTNATIYMEAVDVVGALGTATVPKLIKLDNTTPATAITITSGGGPCGDFTVSGPPITGTYSVSDNEALGGVSFSLEPPPPSGVFSLTHMPTSPPSPTSESGIWTLVPQVAGTAGLNPCGYVLRFDGSDRTIVNGGSPGGWYIGYDVPAFAGFCLKP